MDFNLQHRRPHINSLILQSRVLLRQSDQDGSTCGQYIQYSFHSIDLRSMTQSWTGNYGFKLVQKLSQGYYLCSLFLRPAGTDSLSLELGCLLYKFVPGCCHRSETISTKLQSSRLASYTLLTFTHYEYYSSFSFLVCFV